VPLLETSAQSHTLPAVARWAREQLKFISAEISAERKRDDELSAGIR
jgi:hypothetical protein